MPPLRSIGALLALALLAAPAPAQEKHVFHADKDLPGFEAAGFSEWSDLYSLGSFQSAEGQELGAAELEELRTRWKAEQERVSKRIAAIEADPRERCAWSLEKRLARSSYFSKIAYDVLRPDPGCVLVLQRPAKEDAEYAPRMSAFYVPFVKKLEANFEALVAKPAGLARREGEELAAFAVLASKGDFDNFLRFTQDPGGFTGSAAYDAGLGLAVTYEDPFVGGVSVVGQRSNLLYEFARELLHAHLAVAGSRPGSVWLSEGLALLLATHAGAAPDSLDGKTLRPDATACLMEVLDKEPDNELLLLSADEWAGLRSWNGYCNAVAARAKRRGVNPPPRELRARAFYAQCELWAHYLIDGAQGAYRKPYTEFLKAAFRGKGGSEDLVKAFAGLDLRSISRDFLRYACSEYERTHPGERANGLGIDRLFLDSTPATEPETDPAAGEAPGSAAATAAPAPLASASFAPAMLAPGADDTEAQLALALADARAGDLDLAQQSLQSLAAQAPAAPWPERLAREEARLAELAKLRLAYLAFLQANGSKLSFQHKGKPLMAPVVAVEDGLVRLGDNRLGLPSIPLASVDPFEVAKVAAKKEQQGEAQPWARSYAYLLAGDARWEKLLKDDSKEARELRADAGEYTALRATALTARELFELSKLPLPRDAVEGTACLERIRTLLAAASGSGLLQRRMEPLRQLARAALAAKLKDSGAASFLHGKWTELEAGRGRLVYEFDSADEGEDWVKVPGYLERERKSYPLLGRSEEKSSFAVSKGALRGVGAAVYRLRAGFTGPVSVRYVFHYEDTKQAYASPYFYWLCCDDGSGGYYAASSNGQVHIEDLKHDVSRTQSAPDSHAFDFDVDWKVEFSYDGESVKSALQGEARASLPAGKLTKGWVTFVAHSDLPIVILRVEIEGTLDPATLAALQDSWAARALHELGFP